MDKKIIIGFLAILILSSSVYITLNDDVRIEVEQTETQFKVPRSDMPWFWTVSGTEENRLFDGTSIMNRDRSGIEIDTRIDESTNEVWITRTTPYIRGPVVKDIYYFRGDVEDLELFPISHTVNILNASGKFYRYTVDDLSETGERRKIEDRTFLYFGKNMKVEFQKKNKRWSWVGWPYGSDSFSAQYDIPSDNETYKVRLLDPKTSLDIGNYSEDDLKVIFSDTLNGENFLNLTLKSHSSVNEVKNVCPNEIDSDSVNPCAVSMYYDAPSKYYLQNALGEPTFTDVNTGELVDRDWRYVIQVNETYESPIYSYSNTTLENGTIISDRFEVGTENKTREVWVPYNSRDIPEGNNKIGIEVEVRPQDYIDGIWDVGGKRIEKHAEWTTSLEEDIHAWYRLNESSGSTMIDATGNFTGTHNDGVPNAVTGVSDVTSNAQNYSGAIDYSNTTINPDSWGNFTIQYWIKKPALGGGTFMGYDDFGGSGTSDSFSMDDNSDTIDSVRFFVREGSSTSITGSTNISDEVFHHVVLRRLGDNVTLWVDGNLDGTTTFSDPIDGGSGRRHILIGAREGDAGSPEQFSNVTIDEFAIAKRGWSDSEIATVYNEGNGCTYQSCSSDDPPSISINSPVNEFNSSSNSIDFNVTANDDVGIANVSLYGNWTGGWHLNETNSSGFNASNYVFSKNIGEGYYLWGASATDSGSQTTFTSNRTLFIDTTNPVVNYVSPTEVNEANKSQDWIFINLSVTEANFQNITYNLIWANNGTSVNTTTLTSEQYEINFTGLGDGKYQYNATVVDRTSNSDTAQNRNITLDTTSPNVQFNPPTTVSGNITEDFIQSNVTASDSTVGLDTITTYLYNDTTLIQSFQSGSSPNVTNYTGLSDGVYFLNATANDTLGQENSTPTRTITIDTTNPGIEFAPNTDEGIVTRDYILINVSVDELNLDSVVLNWQGVNETFDNQQGIFYWENKTGLDNVQQYSFYAFANDTNGQGNQTANRTVNTQNPLILKDTNVTLGGHYKYHYVLIQNSSVLINDSIGWLNITTEINITINKSTFDGVGRSNITGPAGGTAGTVEGEDGSSGGGSFGSVGGGPGTGGTAESSGGSGGSGGLAGNVTGNKTERYEVVLAGNPASGAGGGGQYDASAGGSCSTGANAGGGAQGRKGGSAIRFHSKGLVLVEGYMNVTGSGGPSGGVGGGDCTNSNDAEGGSGGGGAGASGGQIIFDGRTVNITLAELIAEGGSAGSGGSAAPGSTGFQGSAGSNGQQGSGGRIKIFYGILHNDSLVYSVAGSNRTINGVPQPGTIYYELTAPDITLYQPEENAFFSEQNVTFIGSVSDDVGIQNVSLRIDGIINETNSSGINNANYTFDKNISEGVHNWTYLAYDLSNVSVEKPARTFTIDLTNPLVEFTDSTDTNGTFVNRDWIFVNISAIDTNLDSARMEFDGVNETFTSNQGIFYWENKTGLTDGEHNFYGWANDSAGRLNTTETRTVTVDTVNPNIEFVSPTTASGNRSQTFIQANVSTNDTNLDTTTVFLYNTTGLVQSNVTTSNQIFVNFTLLSDGLYFLNATVNDSAGNTNKTVTRNITLDITNPLVEYTSNSDSGEVFRDWIFVNISVIETNLDTVVFNWNGTNETFNNNAGIFYWENKTGLNADENYTHYGWANDTAGNSNGTVIRSVKTNPLFEFNITISDCCNLTFTGNISEINTGVSAAGQNGTQGVFTANNNLTNNIDIYANLNETFSNITFYIGNNSNYSQALEITTSQKIVYYNLSINDTQFLWAWADFNESLQGFFPDLIIKADKLVSWLTLMTPLNLIENGII